MDQNELVVNIKRQKFTLKLSFPIIFSKKYIFKNLFFERKKTPHEILRNLRTVCKINKCLE